MTSFFILTNQRPTEGSGTSAMAETNTKGVAYNFKCTYKWNSLKLENHETKWLQGFLIL